MRVAAEARDIELTLASDEDGLRVFGDAELLTTAVANLVTNAVNYSETGTRVGIGARRVEDSVEVDRHRPGSGHPRGRAGAHLRALLPGRRRPLARHRRHRPGPGDRQARLRQPRGPGERLEPGGARLDLHDDPSRGGRPAARRRASDDGRSWPEPYEERALLTRILIVEDEGRSRTRCPTCSARRATRWRWPERPRRADRVRRDRRRPRAARPHAARAVRHRRVRALRQRSTVPVIMLTAGTARSTRWSGLELGADDYVTRPYCARELLARVKAVLRGWPSPRRCCRPRLEAGPVRMDVERHVVTVRGSQCRSRSRSSSCSRCCCATPGACSPGGGSSTACRAATTSATPRPSTCTSSACARRWRPTRPTRAHRRRAGAGRRVRGLGLEVGAGVDLRSGRGGREGRAATHVHQHGERDAWDRPPRG